MTHEQVMAIGHLIEPGDRDKVQQITFDLAELKTLQGIIIDRIEQDDREQNSAYLPHRELVAKLEYFITEFSS